METQQSIISFNISDWSGLVSRHDFIHFLSSILETKKKLTFGFKIGHMSRSLSHKCSNNPNSSIDSKIGTVFCFPTRYSFWNFSGITREILRPRKDISHEVDQSSLQFALTSTKPNAGRCCTARWRGLYLWLSTFETISRDIWGDIPTGKSKDCAGIRDGI